MYLRMTSLPVLGTQLCMYECRNFIDLRPPSRRRRRSWIFFNRLYECKPVKKQTEAYVVHENETKIWISIHSYGFSSDKFQLHTWEGLFRSSGAFRIAFLSFGPASVLLFVCSAAALRDVWSWGGRGPWRWGRWRRWFRGRGLTRRRTRAAHGWYMAPSSPAPDSSDSWTPPEISIKKINNRERCRELRVYQGAVFAHDS